MLFRRFLSFIIDLFIAGILFLIISYINVYIRIDILKVVLMVIPFAFLFCKDSFTGRSIGSIATNLSIVNKEDDNVVAPLKALIRNLFLVIWPIEFIVLLIRKERIGDIVTHTKIIRGKSIHSLGKNSIILFLGIWILLSLIMYILYSDPLMKLLW